MQSGLEYAGWAILAVLAILLGLTVKMLFHEQEQSKLPRVLIPGLAALLLGAAALGADYPLKDAVLAVGELVALLAGFAFFLPVGRPEEAAIPADMLPIDERDIMFARAGYKPGESNYEDYYQRHPEHKDTDDHIRTLPGICAPGSLTYDPLISRMTVANFAFLDHIKPFVEGKPAAEKQVTDPADITRKLKGFARYGGAKVVGVTELKPYHYYSHRGRRPENYGDVVPHKHKYAIVFAVEMDYWMVKGAPQSQVALESSQQYVEGAKIGMMLSFYIRELGYDARNHMDGNYLVCAPLVAQDAGLGELSRMGILVTENYGPRVRLGVVTTDLPLVTDRPIAFGVQNFCAVCKKCAENCPSQAIPHGEKATVAGVRKWQIDQAKCFEFWCRVGTDCAICVNTCPYSKPDTLLHKFARFSLKQSAIARQTMVIFDNYLYGRRPYSRKKPDWLQ